MGTTTEGLPPAKVMEGTISGNQFDVMGEVFIKQGSGGPVTPPPPSGGTLTITGIPTDYNGKYAYFMTPGNQVNGAQAINMETGVVTLVQISNGRVSIPTWTMNTSGNVVRYSGSDTVLEVSVFIWNSSTITTNESNDDPWDDSLALRFYDSITFSSGSATKTWAQGADEDPQYPGGNNPLIGTWSQSGSVPATITFNSNGTLESSVNNNPNGKGTYTVNGNNISYRYTQFLGSGYTCHQLGTLYGITFGSQWYTEAQMRSFTATNTSITPNYQEVLTTVFPQYSGTYSIDGNSLTMTMSRDGSGNEPSSQTFTRIN